MVYLNDHRPAHVHVLGKGCEAVFDLHCPQGPPAVRENYKFSQHDLGKIAGELTSHIELLCAKWRDIHEDL